MAAHVVKIGEEPIRGLDGKVSFSFALWTDLKLSAVLKGEVDEEELNRRPLSIRLHRNERLPKIGGEFIVSPGSIETTMRAITACDGSGGTVTSSTASLAPTAAGS